MKKLLMLAALMGLSFSTSGCLVAAAAGAGAIVADELGENDGKFDPLEDAYDGDEDTEVLSKD